MVFQKNQEICNGRYTILGVMGEGRFGITYRTRNLDNQLVLIKTLNDKAIYGQDFERLQHALIKEAWKLAKCRSPYIVKTEEPFQENHFWCIPMEYIPGESLENYVLSKTDKKISEEEALKYISQVSQALQEVHKNDLLHLDVRPANILLRIRDQKIEAVLIDFGLARRLNDPVTKTFSKEITHGFSPPELYSSKEKLDVRTDIYSLGATLYFLLTGKIPPKLEDQKLRDVQLEFSNSISHRLKQAILWAMNLKAENRPQSVLQWTEEGLGVDIYRESNLDIPFNPSTPPVQSRNSWQSVVIPAIAAFGALLAGLGGVAALMQALKPVPVTSPTPNSSMHKP